MGGITHLLRPGAQHYRNQPIRNKGAAADNWVLLGSHKFRVAPASAGDRTVGESQHARCTHAGYSDADAGFQRDDRIVFDGITYTVIAESRPSMRPGKPAHHTKWLLRSDQFGTTSS